MSFFNKASVASAATTSLFVLLWSSGAIVSKLGLTHASPFAFLGLNFFNTMEYQMRHMDRLFGEVHRRGATTFEISEEANTAYRDRMTQLLGKTVFEKGNCASARSYYFDPAGEATLLRPMSLHDALDEASHFPLSDYQIN